MPKYTRGKLDFTYKDVGRVTGSEDMVETFTCHPKPAGRRIGHAPVLKIDPHQPAKFVQPGERKRLEEFGKKTPTEFLSMSTIIDELKDAFEIKSMDIDLKKVPQAWRKPLDCFDVEIAVEVQSALIIFMALPTEDVTMDKVTWPKGDPVANFRIVVPDTYRFVKHLRYNPKCCPLLEGAVQPPDQTERGAWEGHNLPNWEFSIEWDGKMMITPDYGLKGEYFKWGAEYIFPYNPEGEEFPPQPWIMPRIKF